MYRDLAGHDYLAQHIAGQALLRRRAAAAAPGKQGMGRDGDGLGRCFPRGQGIAVPAAGQQFQPCHGLLAVKHLHAVQNLALPAAGIGPQAVDCVGTHRGIVLLQAVLSRRGGQISGLGGTGFVCGQVGQAHAGFIINRQLYIGYRGSLPRHRCVNLDTACWHSKTPPCTTVCTPRRGRVQRCCAIFSGICKMLDIAVGMWQNGGNKAYFCADKEAFAL